MSSESIGANTPDERSKSSQKRAQSSEDSYTPVARCLGTNTQVTMADGSTRFVQDISNGDKVMGDDGTARKVIAFSTGSMDLYCIREIGGDGIWACSGDHLCVLIVGRPRIERADVDGMVVVTTTPHVPKAETVTVPVESARELLARHRTEFLVPARELESACANVAPLKVYMRRASTLPAIFPPQMTLDDAYHAGYGLLSAKELSVSDAWQSPQHRSAMVAGAVDAAGSLTVAIESPQVRAVFATACRSLCITVRMGSGTVTLDGGAAVIVPFLRSEGLADAAVASAPARFTYPFTVSAIGKDSYYGFDLDGNRRFLLGDLTVTHNSTPE
ncbi:hypothetical protein J8273_3888 [Carpediemonas membranifera]|uniref:Hom-end-associated Hint domain-containing protein n=1 Tax=Carpediemonas membranifera TaxID=201153 RepID=A0A8J6B7C9_9EUKA|nr:hypothetical protein J8273_3888 [Carpediemonas membranifera]|eukprot:KAG9394634.1 hypothetical protein J8273_3888 [Carpediemonas membranifera]